MHISTPPSLTSDEIDDLLYFTRAHETTDLQQSISALSQKHQCQPRDVLAAAINPESGNSVLHFCSANGFDDLATEFLSQLSGGGGGNDAGAPTDGTAAGPELWNRGNKQGNTPLHWAAYNGHLAIVKQLVAAGADMWIKNAAGHLAMFEAERADKSDVVQFLLEAGGKEVETTGTERPATAEDVEGTQAGEPSNGAEGGESGDIDMDGQTSNG